jgi:hypothetical protein
MTKNLCPVCQGKINLERHKEKPVWVASCQCTQVESALMTGIVFSLVAKAMKQASSIEEKSQQKNQERIDNEI